MSLEKLKRENPFQLIDRVGLEAALVLRQNNGETPNGYLERIEKEFSPRVQDAVKIYAACQIIFMLGASSNDSLIPERAMEIFTDKSISPSPSYNHSNTGQNKTSIIVDQKPLYIRPDLKDKLKNIFNTLKNPHNYRTGEPRTNKPNIITKLKGLIFKPDLNPQLDSQRTNFAIDNSPSVQEATKNIFTQDNKPINPWVFGKAAGEMANYLRIFEVPDIFFDQLTKAISSYYFKNEASSQKISFSPD